MAEAEIYYPPPEAPAPAFAHHHHQQPLAPAVAIPLPPEVAVAATVPEYSGGNQNHHHQQHQHQQSLPTICIQPQVFQPQPSTSTTTPASTVCYSSNLAAPEQALVSPPPPFVPHQKKPNRCCTKKAVCLAAIFVMVSFVALVGVVVVVIAMPDKSDSSKTSGGSSEQYDDPSSTKQEMGDNDEAKIVGNPLPFSASIDMMWNQKSQEFEISLAQLNGLGTVKCTLKDEYGMGNPNVSFYTPEYEETLCSSSSKWEPESSFDTETCSYTTTSEASVLPNIVVRVSSAYQVSKSSLYCYQDKTPTTVPATVAPTPSPSAPAVVLYESNPFGMQAGSSSDSIVPRSVGETGTITCSLSVLEGGGGGVGFSVSAFQGGALCSAGVDLACSFDAESLPSTSIAVHIQVRSEYALVSYSCVQQQ